MRRWCKALAILAGGLLGLGEILSSVTAQPPKGPPPPPPVPNSLPDTGCPNAFSSLYDLRTRESEPILPYFVRNHLLGVFPGIFHRAPTAAIPADFPDPAEGSCQPATAFSVRPEGMANGFTELTDPRGEQNVSGGGRLLFTELLAPAPQVQAPYTISLRGEYLPWRMGAGPSSAVLVTTTPSPTLASFGALSDPNTVILVNSGSPIDYGYVGGMRMTMGLCLHYIPPLEVSGFCFNTVTNVFSGGSLTNPTELLAIPFQEVRPGFIIPGTNIGTESAVVIAVPTNSALGGLGGTLNIASQLSFWNIEANFFLPLGESDCLKLDMIVGYRHLQLNETLSINTQAGGSLGSVFFNGNLMPQGLFSTATTDTFQTKNSFDGGQIGLRGILTSGRWSLMTDGKIGFGITRDTLAINGVSTLIQTTPGRTSESLPGGIFALPSNSGSLSTNLPAFVPEVNFTVSFQATSNCRFYAGYNFIYYSAVARPGDFISPLIDSRQMPTSANYTPGVTYNGPSLPSSVSHHDFASQGFFFGIEIGF